MTSHPMILPMVPPQPQPLATRVTHYRSGSLTLTSINRDWPESSIGRCKLCDRCTVDDALGCLITVNTFVSHDEAPLFSIRGVSRQAPAATPRIGGGR
jgi:hypothetical protein